MCNYYTKFNTLPSTCNYNFSCTFLHFPLIIFLLIICTDNILEPQDVSSLAAAFKLIVPVASEWQNIAVLLGIPDYAVAAIYVDYSKVHDCLTAVLKEWLKQTNPPPSLKALVEAAEVLGYHTLAQKICSKFSVGLESNWTASD